MRRMFSLTGALLVMLAFCATAGAAPLVYEGIVLNGVTAYGDVPLNSYSDAAQWDFWYFLGSAGDVVTITCDRTSDQMDPGVNLYQGFGTTTDGLAWGTGNGELTFLEADDDGGSDVPPGPFYNSLIADFVLPGTGYYTLGVSDVLGAGTGPWTYGLTVRGSGYPEHDVPEPTTLVMLALAGAGLALRKRLLG